MTLLQTSIMSRTLNRIYFQPNNLNKALSRLGSLLVSVVLCISSIHTLKQKGKKKSLGCATSRSRSQPLTEEKK